MCAMAVLWSEKSFRGLFRLRGFELACSARGCIQLLEVEVAQWQPSHDGYSKGHLRARYQLTIDCVRDLEVFGASELAT